MLRLAGEALRHETDGEQTYDKMAISALVGTLRMLFELRPKLQVIISGAVRNEETFETFRHACCASPALTLRFSKTSDPALAVRNQFEVEEIEFQPKPMREQTALFYATAVPLKILSITRTEREEE